MRLATLLTAVLALGLSPVSAQTTHNTGTVTLQVFGNGFLGQNLGVGSGFTYTGTNGLFEGQLMVGNSSTRVSGQPYASDPSTPPTDWVQTAAPTALTGPFPAPYNIFNQGFQATFTDAAAPSPFGLSVRQRTYSSSTAPNNDFVVVVYDITNTSSTAYTGMYVGFFADWDVNAATANSAGFDPATQSLYVFDTVAPTKYYGTAVLGTTATGYSLELGAGTNPTDAQAFVGMSTPGGPVAVPQDIRTIIGQGNVALPAGGTISATFALIGGDTQADFLVNAAAARGLFPVGDESGPQDRTSALSFVRPNPTAGDASLTLTADQPQAVRVTLHDALGREVAVLFDGVTSGEAQTLRVATDGLPGGVYVVRATGETFSALRRVVVTR